MEEFLSLKNFLNLKCIELRCFINSWLRNIMGLFEILKKILKLLKIKLL